MYIAVSDSGIEHVAPSIEEARDGLCESIVEIDEAWCADDEVSTYTCRVSEAHARRWGDVRERYPWTDLQSVPDYDDTEATVYDEGRTVETFKVTTRYNPTTEQWEVRHDQRSDRLALR